MIMNLSVTTQFLFVMSDSTGFGSGGISPLLKVGKSTIQPFQINVLNPILVGHSRSGGLCESDNSIPYFSYNYDPTTLKQCQSFDFNSYGNAIQVFFLHFSFVVVRLT